MLREQRGESTATARSASKITPRRSGRAADGGAEAADPALHRRAEGRGAREVARSRGVPAYVVLHDSTIDGIAADAPDDARPNSAASPGSATRSSSITATS